MYSIQSPEENHELGVEAKRLEDFDAGRLDEWEIVILLQDILESGVVHILPHKFLILCAYYAEMGLVNTVNRGKH